MLYNNGLFQCRKFKNSERIKAKAEVIYNKFKTLFLNGDRETAKVIQVNSFFLLKKFVLTSKRVSIVAWE